MGTNVNFKIDRLVSKMDTQQKAYIQPILQYVRKNYKFEEKFKVNNICFVLPRSEVTLRAQTKNLVIETKCEYSESEIQSLCKKAKVKADGIEIMYNKTVTDDQLIAIMQLVIKKENDGE